MKKKLLALLLSAGAAAMCVVFLLQGPAPVLLENGAEEENGGYEFIPDGYPPLTDAPAAPSGDGAEMNAIQLQAAREILLMVNADRQEKGLGPLELDTALCNAAQIRAEECVGTFSHTRPNGTPYKTAIAEAGVTATAMGENVATGFDSPEKAMKGWEDSPGHMENILREKFTRIGVGLAPNTGNKYSGYAWAQLFANG